MSFDLKLSFKQLGLYYIREANTIKGTYMLEEMDRTYLKGIYTRNYLKKFIFKGNTFILIDKTEESDFIKLDLTKGSDSQEEDSTKDKGLL